MRRWRLLVLGSLAAALCAGAHAAPPAESMEGMVSLESSGDGATLLVTGVLTASSFEFQAMRVVGSRLAGRTSDPDQLRVYLFDARGGKLGVLKTWSPLLQFQWDIEGVRESALNLEKAVVIIQIPATLTLAEISLRWPQGKEMIRLDVRDAIRSFCELMPKNPACGAPPK